MTTLDAETKQSLQNVLSAYLHHFGGTELFRQIRAIAGSILSVKEKIGDLVSEGMEIEAWVDELVTGFDPENLADQMWDAGEQAIAAQTKIWRETLETKAQATVDATIQKYLPDLKTIRIQDIVATVLPIVEDARISRDEAQHVIQAISRQFDWQAALSRVIDSKWIFLAEKTMQAIRTRDVEASVEDVMAAYVNTFKPSLAEMGEGLIEQAVEAVFNSKVLLDIDMKLEPGTRRLLVQQVALKFRLRDASPPPSKTAFEIAQQVHDEVARYRQEQGLNDVAYSPPVIRTDETDGSRLGGGISVGIDIQPGANPPHDRANDE